MNYEICPLSLSVLTMDKTAHYTGSLYTTKYLQSKAAVTSPKHKIKPLSWPSARERSWGFCGHIAITLAICHELGSWAQKASGSGQKREKSSISRFAMCQLTKRASIDLNSRRMVGKSHHISSSLSANTITKLFRRWELKRSLRTQIQENKFSTPKHW